MSLLFYQTKSNCRFVFQQPNPDAMRGREIPDATSVPPETSSVPASPTEVAEAAKKNAKKITGDNAIMTCMPDSCRIERPKSEWQEEANVILRKIMQADTNTRVKFGTVLKEYALAYDVHLDVNETELIDGFYTAIKAIGVKDTQEAYDAAWKNILSVAEASQAGLPQKPPNVLGNIIAEGKAEFAQRKEK